MLGPGRYLLGVLEVLWLTGFATLGAVAVRRRLVPDFTGTASLLATLVLAAALLIWTAEALGTFGAFEPLPYLALVGVIGVSTWTLLPRAVTGPAGRSVDVPTLIALAVAAIAVIH